MNVDKVKQMADAGVSAVVLASLFEEQIRQEAERLDYFLHYGENRFAESLSYYPAIDTFRTGPDLYLRHIEALKEAVDIPVIASLNGVSSSGWTDYAAEVASAGADAIELNVCFLPTSPNVPGELVEDAHESVVKSVVEKVSLPVAVKLSPFFSATASMAKALVDAGASGLVLFNRFYQPDIDVETMEVSPRLVLSTSVENRLPLRWIAVLHGRLKCSLAASTGIHTAEDAAKMILAGADVVCMTAALIQNGPGHAAAVCEGLSDILSAKGYKNVAEMRGALSHLNCAEPSAFERANYIKTIGQYKPVGTHE